jgi:hypothetical protein
MNAKKREEKKRKQNEQVLKTILRSEQSPKHCVKKPFDVVKVFSATKARDRATIGSRATEYLRDFSGYCVGKVVCLSSDREFHCLTLVLFMKRG